MPSSTGPGYVDPLTTRSLSYAPADAVPASGNFTVYQHVDPGFASYVDRLQLFKAGAANTAIALTYVSFGIQEVSNGTTFLQRDYFIFGAPTSPVPTTGSATYAGIVDGTYNKSSLGQTYLISGTSTLTADFAAATVGTTMNFTGTNVLSGQPGLTAQTFTGTGLIAALNNRQFGGNFSGMGLPGGGTFEGNFYGNQAEEFGYVFHYNGATDQFVGVAVGKK